MVAENVVIFDGQIYQKGEEIWDLGSIVCVASRGSIRVYEGVSEDVDKLPHYVGTGSSCLMVDTGDLYKFNKSKDTWYKL